MDAAVASKTVKLQPSGQTEAVGLPAGMGREFDLTIIRQLIQHTIEVFIKRVFHWTSVGKRRFMVCHPCILDAIVGIIVDERKPPQRFDWDPGRLAACVGICSVDRRRVVHDADAAV